MSEQFTPGPWFVPESAPLAINSNPHNIATANFVNGKANARLIATAPDLYRVVGDLLSYPSVCAAIGEGFEGRAHHILAKARGDA